MNIEEIELNKIAFERDFNKINLDSRTSDNLADYNKLLLWYLNNNYDLDVESLFILGLSKHKDKEFDDMGIHLKIESKKINKSEKKNIFIVLPEDNIIVKDLLLLDAHNKNRSKFIWNKDKVVAILD